MNEEILNYYKRDIDKLLNDIYPINIRCSNNKRRKMNLPFRRGRKINRKFKNQKYLNKIPINKIFYNCFPKIETVIEECCKNIQFNNFVEIENFKLGDKT